MFADQFIKNRQSNWERLSSLVSSASNKGLSSLSAEELYELGRLYRTATSDLAIAQRDYANHRVVDYLNTLVAQTHGVIYRTRSTTGQQFLRFFTHSFPQAFRSTWRYSLAAFLMMFLPTLLAFFFTWRDPAAGTVFLPGSEELIDNIRAQREWWLSINEDGRSASASLIMTNNIRVALMAFAGGILLGIFSLWVLVQNGLMLGVVAGAAQAYGFSDRLWGFVAAHAAIELSVIFIAGGAGLQLGWSILRPGLLPRRAALAIAARRAITILMGCVPLLVIAGLIEGFISPSALPSPFKYTVSFVTGALLYAYLLLSGREQIQ